MSDSPPPAHTTCRECGHLGMIPCEADGAEDVVTLTCLECWAVGRWDGPRFVAARWP